MTIFVVQALNAPDSEAWTSSTPGLSVAKARDLIPKDAADGLPPLPR